VKIVEEVEVFCHMTRFRRHLLVEYTVDGVRRTVEVSAG
jgi:hypothetical protein